MNTNNITVTGYASYTHFMQAIEKYSFLVGKALTLAIRCKGVSGGTAGLAMIDSADTIHGNTQHTLTGGWQTIVETVTIPGEISTTSLWFAVYTASALDVEWAALYEGSYTAETLPEYQPKGYENELLVCRQYDPITGEYIGLRKFSPPRNLLDNSDFRNPVNQRGNISGNITNWTYCIDRWICGNATYNIVTSGITISPYGTESEHLMAQYLEKLDFLIGKKITFAIGLAGGNVCLATGVVPAKSDWAQIAQSETDGVKLQVVWSGSPNYLMPRILISKDTTVAWAALYEGAYTAETLPEYQPKGYGAELLECQRYYYIYRQWARSCAKSGNTNVSHFNFQFPITMRTNPALQYDIEEGTQPTQIAVNAYGIESWSDNGTYTLNNISATADL